MANFVPYERSNFRYDGMFVKFPFIKFIIRRVTFNSNSTKYLTGWRLCEFWTATFIKLRNWGWEHPHGNYNLHHPHYDRTELFSINKYLAGHNSKIILFLRMRQSEVHPQANMKSSTWKIKVNLGTWCVLSRNIPLNKWTLIGGSECCWCLYFRN